MAETDDDTVREFRDDRRHWNFKVWENEMFGCDREKMKVEKV